MPEPKQTDYTILLDTNTRLVKMETRFDNMTKMLEKQAEAQTELAEAIKGNGKIGLGERVNKNCASIKELKLRNAEEDAKEEKQEEKEEERILKYKDLIIMFIISNILTGTVAALTAAFFK